VRPQTPVPGRDGHVIRDRAVLSDNEAPCGTIYECLSGLGIPALLRLGRLLVALTWGAASSPPDADLVLEASWPLSQAAEPGRRAAPPSRAIGW
jgi:hypothetical protein